MRIGIIGVGNVGSALTRAAVAAGHTVALSAAHPERAEAVAAAHGATAETSNVDLVKGADVVVLAVPTSAVPTVAAEAASVVAGKVVIDATNPLNETFSDLAIGATTSGGEAVAQLLPGAAVVKAFNTLMAGRIGQPDEQGVPLDAFYAGDDEEAKAVVRDFVASLGYRPIDAGGLRMARALEEMALLNIVLNSSNGWSWQTGWKLMGPTD
ncbi:NADPH-dependent F420 reductase [Pseudonocardia xinjiangensis]|uniref:NADPH-dependent F420 reductase n=1 Tax=Pseudonocardia xinjiangensis TaxID=75289 RepID=UPI003D8D1C4F